MSFLIDTFDFSKLHPEWEKIQMKIFPTQDGAFEVFVHYPNSANFWLFNFNTMQIFGLQTF